MGAGVMLPAAMFIYAWTSFPHVHWIAPIIGITVSYPISSPPPSVDNDRDPPFSFLSLKFFKLIRFCSIDFPLGYLYDLHRCLLVLGRLVSFSFLFFTVSERQPSSNWIWFAFFCSSYGPFASSALAGQNLARKY